MPLTAKRTSRAFSPAHSGWLIHSLYVMRQRGEINDLEARWILACVYGEQGLREIIRQLEETRARR